MVFPAIRQRCPDSQTLLRAASRLQDLHGNAFSLFCSCRHWPCPGRQDFCLYKVLITFKQQSSTLSTGFGFLMENKQAEFSSLEVGDSSPPPPPPRGSSAKGSGQVRNGDSAHVATGQWSSGLGLDYWLFASRNNRHFPRKLFSGARQHQTKPTENILVLQIAAGIAEAKMMKSLIMRKGDINTNRLDQLEDGMDQRLS